MSASDLSESSLELARANGRRLGLEVRWLHADLLAGHPATSSTRSSPTCPTSPSQSAPTLAPEILRHEPPEALFAGPDGLAAIRALLALVRERRRVALVALEVGAGHAGEVAELIAARGLLRGALASATWPGSSAWSWASASMSAARGCRRRRRGVGGELGGALRSREDAAR